MSLPDYLRGDQGSTGMMGLLNGSERGRSPGPQGSGPYHSTAMSARGSHSPSRPPTSAQIDAVIAAAMANAPPAPQAPPPDFGSELVMPRSTTPLMTNLLPSAVGMDGRVNLFVGNLPYRVRWQDLKDLFRKAGTVLRADVSLGPDNRSRGYGTVLMGSREDAARAIDRFNGYTWQTRTLEVRPDRLPPEYEPQPHANHHVAPPRPPLYTYHNMSGGGSSAFSLPGHLTPSNGPAWLPGQMPSQRPPMNFPPGAPGSQQMSSVNSLPGVGLSPHPPLMALEGTSPIPSSQSPISLHGNADIPLPLSGQNIGNHVYQHLGASPLAGSLTAGTVPAPLNSFSTSSRRESITPFAHSVTSDANGSLPRGSVSPNGDVGLSTSRPTSSTGRLPRSHSPANGTSDFEHQAPPRVGPPGHLASLFGSVESAISPTESGLHPSQSAPNNHPGPSFSIGAQQALPVPMEGLAHQASGLGPPTTLHDRVVFVSNLPLTMQWQELKDFLRPAGIIIRADVATDLDGRPRGFGTALFATESDAAKAVAMYNDRNLGGRKVRVHLERDSHHDLHPRRPSDQFSAGVRASPPAPANGFWQTPYPQHNGGPPHLSMAAYPQETQTGDSPSPSAARLPWALNTSLNGIQTTPARGPLGNGGGEGSPHISFRQMHHPGPISMPPFPSMENGNPLSPLQTRGFPPMTPSMPGFVFNAYPETPPIHAHFLSPGLGPFSPGIPVTSPTAYSYNSFLNLAPGGPVNRFPQGGSAQLDTPTTQSFPSNLIHGYAGAPGPANISQALAGVGNDYFPSQPLGPAPNPPSPSPRVPNRPKATASPLNAGDHLVETPWGEGHSDLSLLTASMSLNGARDVNRPAPTSLGQSQRSASGLNLADLVKGEAHANRASLDGPRPTLDAGWTGERRASFGDIGSREAK